MSLSCSVVRDLLPLYAEDLLSEDSCHQVSEHLAECDRCRQGLEELRGETEPLSVPALPTDRVRQLLRRSTLLCCLLVGCLVAALSLALMGRMTTAQTLPYTDNSFACGVDEDGFLYARVTDHAPTGVDYRIHYLEDGQGGLSMCIRGYTSPWLRAAGLSSRSLVYRAQSDQVRRIFYQNPQGDLRLLCGPAPAGVTVPILLPRLTLNYYFLTALALALLFGLVWFLLRKTTRGEGFGWCGLVFGCYAVSHVLIKGFSGATELLTQDLCFLLLTTALLFGAAFSLIELRRTYRM